MTRDKEGRTRFMCIDRYSSYPHVPLPGSGVDYGPLGQGRGTGHPLEREDAKVLWKSDVRLRPCLPLGLIWLARRSVRVAVSRDTRRSLAGARQIIPQL